MKFTFKKAIAGVIAAAALAAPASAHVWNIGWKSNAGGLTFYGVSYHGSLNANYDNFTTNPAGFVINGTNVTFDIGSVVDIVPNCFGPGGLTSGSCSSQWNALNLDGAIHANGYSSSTYGKWATATLDSTQLSSLGITGGTTNSVTLSTFARNVDWDGKTFSSAAVPIDITVTPPVPLPAGLPLIATVLGAFGFVGWRRRKTA